MQNSGERVHYHRWPSEKPTRPIFKVSTMSTSNVARPVSTYQTKNIIYRDNKHERSYSKYKVGKSSGRVL